jgi:hypothetical protein
VGASVFSAATAPVDLKVAWLLYQRPVAECVMVPQDPHRGWAARTRATPHQPPRELTQEVQDAVRTAVADHMQQLEAARGVSAHAAALAWSSMLGSTHHPSPTPMNPTDGLLCQPPSDSHPARYPGSPGVQRLVGTAVADLRDLEHRLLSAVEARLQESTAVRAPCTQPLSPAGRKRFSVACVTLSVHSPHAVNLPAPDRPRSNG